VIDRRRQPANVVPLGRGAQIAFVGVGVGVFQQDMRRPGEGEVRVVRDQGIARHRRCIIRSDDHRARATLSLLGELSEKTQVLFFTHHVRMLELVRETVPARLLKTHDLDRQVEQHD
jgi:hypothetical protein